MFTALRRQGVPARLLVFPDENHWVLKPVNSVRWYEEVLGWLDRWTKRVSRAAARSGGGFTPPKRRGSLRGSTQNPSGRDSERRRIRSAAAEGESEGVDAEPPQSKQTRSEAERMKARVDGGWLEYDVRGEGAALVLLHAFPLGQFMWDAQCEALSTERRVVRFDARGFGGSDPGEGPLTMERIADDAAALMDALGIERAAVGGCSMGGYAALAFARRHPHRLSALVLQDTKAGADDETTRQNRAALAKRVLEEGAAAAADAFLPRLLGATTRRERPQLGAALRERILETSPTGIAQALHGLARSRRLASVPRRHPGADAGAGRRGGRGDAARGGGDARLGHRRRPLCAASRRPATWPISRTPRRSTRRCGAFLNGVR